jgi:FixJ family two-component response regulator
MKVLEGPRPYALYVLDIESPAKRIAAVAARIRQSQPQARILYFTAFSEALFALHGRLMPGREELLEKPVSNQKLLEGPSGSYSDTTQSRTRRPEHERGEHPRNVRRLGFLTRTTGKVRDAMAASTAWRPPVKRNSYLGGSRACRDIDPLSCD